MRVRRVVIIILLRIRRVIRLHLRILQVEGRQAVSVSMFMIMGNAQYAEQ